MTSLSVSPGSTIPGSASKASQTIRQTRRMRAISAALLIRRSSRMTVEQSTMSNGRTIRLSRSRSATGMPSRVSGPSSKPKRP